jgi:hypothetical protein
VDSGGGDDRRQQHARARSAAMMRKRQTKSGTGELFAEFDADYREASIDEIVAEQKQLAKERLLKMLGDSRNALSPARSFVA